MKYNRKPRPPAPVPVGHHQVKDVAARYGINMKTIQKRISRGKLTVLREGDRTFLSDEAVRHMVETYVSNPKRNRFK